MMERKEVFSCSEFDVGCAKSTQHSVRVTEDKPFRERSRRLPPKDLEDVRKHLNDLKEAGIISESRSPYASPIVVVRKKNGTIRICVDYRALNRRTIPDQYTVPRVEDALTCLSGSKWFSVLDLRSGYYQIPLSDADKEKKWHLPVQHDFINLRECHKASAEHQPRFSVSWRGLLGI